MRFFFATLVTLITFSGVAQMQKGIVIDSLGNPVDNAYLLNTNSKYHAHTDEFGNFNIDKTNISDVLIITALGFKKLEYTIVSNEILIVLTE